LVIDFSVIDDDDRKKKNSEFSRHHFMINLTKGINPVSFVILLISF